MSRRCGVVSALILAAASVAAADQTADLWKEYGLVQTQQGNHGNLKYTAYRMKDLTGALAAWEWKRSPGDKSCDQSAFCTSDGGRTIIFDNNYLVEFENPSPKKADVDAVLQALPNQMDTTLPAILTFLPTQGLVPNSARYVLGEASLRAFAPEFESANVGFAQGVEGQVAEYKLEGAGQPVRLAIFYYPSPGLARAHVSELKLIPNTHVKRSAVLIGAVYGGATEQQADTLLSRIEYEAKITWNETPPPSPIKPLYALLLNILYMSILLSALCLVGGLIYAGMRIYRRRYGQLEADEAMTTLHLTGD